jgi:hypothetical protein
MITALATIVYESSIEVIKWTAEKSAGLVFLTVGLPWLVRYAVSYLYSFAWYYGQGYFQQVDAWLAANLPTSVQPVIRLTGVAAYMAIQTDLVQHLNIIVEGLGVAYVVADLRRSGRFI